MHASQQGPARRHRNAAFAALLLGMLMAQLDGTVVVAAMPAIGSGLGAPAAVAAVFTVYLLTVTVSTPIHGALGDRFGRRAVFVVAVLLFATGSLACAAAPSLPALLAARALQGLGGGGLVVTAISALGEMFDAEERVRRQIWGTAVFAVSSLAGPPLGGLVAAGPGWRWIFAVNLPLCVLALVLGFRGVPAPSTSRRTGGFDRAGAVLVAVGGAALFGLGSSDDVARSPLWAPLLVTVALITAVAFVRVERRAPNPLIPPGLFAVAPLARSIIVAGLTGVALFGTFAFVPLALTEGTGADTAIIGSLLLALTGGQLATTTAFSVLARPRPRMAPWGRLALVIGIGGLGLLAALPQLADAPAPLRYAVALAGLALAGAALGLTLSAYTLLGQASAPAGSMGAAMGALTFARQLGGSFGAAAFGWLLLAVPDRSTGLTAVLAVAAAVVTVALLVAPRADPATSAAGPSGLAGHVPAAQIRRPRAAPPHRSPTGRCRGPRRDRDPWRG